MLYWEDRKTASEALNCWRAPSPVRAAREYARPPEADDPWEGGRPSAPRLERLLLFIAIVTATVVSYADTTPIALSDASIRIQLINGREAISVRAYAPITLSDGRELPVGTYTIRASRVTPAKQRFHLFSKTFQPGESEAEEAYLAELRARGFQPEVQVVGNQFHTDQGRILDTRVHWISLAQLATEPSALANKQTLHDAEQWTWMHAEIIASGMGQITIASADGPSATLVAPLRFESEIPIEVAEVDTGYWKMKNRAVAYSGALSAEIGPDGKLVLVEIVPLESYIAGVLPAEMPTSWPAEALKAQAVAARSEVLVSMNTKHRFDGHDFCGTEHCRAYLGDSGRTPQTDAAVRATRGEFLAQGNAIVPAVFSSNCGGATEDNDTVWRAPAHSALRGVSDSRQGAARPDHGAMWSWIARPGAAWCDGDREGFRWTRAYTGTELNAIVNRHHAVGTIHEIELGERGVSGRLKRVRIEGSSATITVEKELPIRRAFGGLPSALFVAEVDSGPSGVRGVTFRGAGRGHGVGMCQHGARGQADAGRDYRSIVGHYYPSSQLVRYR